MESPWLRFDSLFLILSKMSACRIDSEVLASPIRPLRLSSPKVPIKIQADDAAD